LGCPATYVGYVPHYDTTALGPLDFRPCLLKEELPQVGSILKSCNIHNFLVINISAIQSISTVSMPDSPFPGYVLRIVQYATRFSNAPRPMSGALHTPTKMP
jgi:hypothetical protein